MTFTGHDHATEHTPLIQGSNAVINSSSCTNLASKEDSSAKSTKRRLAMATGLAIFFFATELVAGYFANSLGRHILRDDLIVSYINISYVYSLDVGCFSLIIRCC
jgi:Co/Zn/Cd efflux system component